MLAKFSKIPWYWHRLRAMTPREVLLRVQKKAHQRADTKGCPKLFVSLQPSNIFPKLPDRAAAPRELLDGLRESADAILRGEWLAFGHLPLKADDPPNWHKDYLGGKDLRSPQSSFKLDHRAQPDGADIKLVWEPSRWYQLVRLAMAAWLLDDAKARDKCIEWLHDWTKNNPPFTGLNWTSGLEVGLRLVNFTWIDAFLTAAGVPNKTLNELREAILPPHVWYAWRYKSFGSSANNHLLGELAGLILALARWPDLAKISAPLDEIGEMYDREVHVQFAPDGGNQEQALGYHLFSLEFCLHSLLALRAARVAVRREVFERLSLAGMFYAFIKPENDPWDFGDSDNACVTPLFAKEEDAAIEWHRFCSRAASSPALNFWFKDDAETFPSANQWFLFSESGHAVFRNEDWFIRFDASRLGFLSMAPHGHLDALHVSVWYRGEPLIIDPGTGAYYADKAVRNYLADWAAHNSPHLRTPPETYPKRFGTFLWGAHHKPPQLTHSTPLEITGTLELPYGLAIRSVAFLPESNSIRINDTFHHPAKTGPVTTRWKFAPQLTVKDAGANEFLLSSTQSAVRLSASPEWTSFRIFNPPEELRGKTASTLFALGSVPIQSIVSPAFRSVAVAPYLALESAGEGPFSLTISPA